MSPHTIARHSFGLLSILSLGFGASSCTTEGDRTKNANVVYRLGCEASEEAHVPCVGGRRDIFGDEGETLVIECSVRDVDATSKAVDMTLRQTGGNPSPIGFKIVNAIFNEAGVLQNSGGASFQLYDGANTYSGALTATDPVACTSANIRTCQPCQVTNLGIAEDMNTGSPYVRADIRCVGLPQAEDPSKTFEFTATTADASNEYTIPSQINVFFCDGI